MSNTISLVCLVLTGALATWGVFSKHFEDTLPQRIGLSIIAMACLLRVPGKLGGGADTPPELLLAQIGLCVYGLATAVKVARSVRAGRRRGRRADDPPARRWRMTEPGT